VAGGSGTPASFSSLARAGWWKAGMVQRGAVSVHAMNGQLPIVSGLGCCHVAFSVEEAGQQLGGATSCLINFSGFRRSCY
jgi:hypothetical protein